MDYSDGFPILLFRWGCILGLLYPVHEAFLGALKYVLHCRPCRISFLKIPLLYSFMYDLSYSMSLKIYIV